MDHAAALHALGGIMPVSAALRCHRSRVSRWIADGIPPRRWRDVAALAEAQGIPGITVASLAAAAPALDTKSGARKTHETGTANALCAATHASEPQP